MQREPSLKSNGAFALMQPFNEATVYVMIGNYQKICKQHISFWDGDFETSYGYTLPYNKKLRKALKSEV